MKLTISKEDYLKAIGEAQSEEGTVLAATVARWVNVSAPAVTLALRRLRRDKLVEVDRKGRISLTPAGQSVADKLRLRHHLVERMLQEMLGVEWYKVHEEAEHLEHAISEDVERRLIVKLGANRPCPHGNQINKSPAERRKAGLQLLGEAPPGSVVRVNSVEERDSKLLEYFDSLGIRPGAQVKVTRANYDGTLGLDLGGKPTNLAETAAKMIWVSAITKPSERAAQAPSTTAPLHR